MLDGTYNFRDVGGLPAGAGRVRDGVLFRSDALSGLTAAGIEMLARSPIGTVIDLRSLEEIDENPDLLPQTRTIELIALPLLEGAARDAVAEATTLGALYAAMARTTGSCLVDLARLVLEERDGLADGILIHCAAGKDRTGFVIAVLLAAVGADREAIVADYAASQAHLSGEWAERAFDRVRASGVPLTPQLSALLAHSPAAAMADTLAYIDAEHGGADAYLRAHGLSADELTDLHDRLIDP